MQGEDTLELQRIFKKQTKQEQKTESEFDTTHRVHNICVRIGHIFVFSKIKYLYLRREVLFCHFYIVESILEKTAPLSFSGKIDL